jgi:hypothetical protein
LAQLLGGRKAVTEAGFTGSVRSVRALRLRELRNRAARNNKKLFRAE